MDETSKRGHNYFTVMVDLAEWKVIYTIEGKEHTTVDRIVKDFKQHNGDPANVKLVTCDMSLEFRKEIRDNLSDSNTSIDKLCKALHNLSYDKYIFIIR